ncbi:MAG: hypothetical protein SOY60_09365 [Fusobacterium gastrosuis]|uniref:hypothetical protein n=1 Tax=Fusobacterium gastrosuis TaxID=1755100 RepID=UPI002A8F5168|nr:hypothetical protein [Fusobacterium gastrosuis]
MTPQQELILLILIVRCLNLKEKCDYASEKALEFYQKNQEKEAQIAFYKGFYDGTLKKATFSQSF